MDTLEQAKEIFENASILFQDGKRESAAMLMSNLVCQSPLKEVRERAGSLLDLYVGKSNEGHANGKGQVSDAMPDFPKPRAKHQLPKMSRPNEQQKQTFRMKYIRTLHAKKIAREGDKSIPADAVLPDPFAPYFLAYLKISDARVTLPDNILNTLRKLESCVQKRPKSCNQDTMVKILQTFAGQFSEALEGKLIFGALVDIFYARGFISSERAFEMSVHTDMGKK